MSNDIRDILQRLTAVESKLTPVGVKSGLNKQQKSVPQLPALFKPGHIKALGAKTDPKHPMDGYMVGDSVEPRKTALEEAMEEIEEDMLSKVKKDLTTYLDKLEKKVRVDRALKDKAQDAVERGEAEEIEEFAPPEGDGDGDGGDEEEILHRLASMWWLGNEQQMARAERTLASMGWEIGEDEGYDDGGVFVVRAGDEHGKSYISWPHEDLQLSEEIDTDPAAMQGPSDPGDTEVAHNIELGVADKLNAPQKPQAPQATFEMADGVALECWGDDDTGYELRRGDKTLPSRFKNLDDAGMAVKLYQARRQKQQRPTQDLSQDYIEER
jgi:hypothetical protein